MLQEGEDEHRHERVAVKTLPGSSFDVVEAKFLFQLRMGLLANPSSLDGEAKLRRSVAAGRLVPSRVRRHRPRQKNERSPPRLRHLSN